MKRARGFDFRILAVVLVALTAALLLLGAARTAELARAEAKIAAVYQKAFYETCELTEGISANCRKLLVAADDMQMQALLGDISRDAQGAASDLALLPLSDGTVSATLKFINQTEDFAASLSEKLAAGVAVSDADRETMAQLSESAARFSVGLNRLLERYERGEASFTGADYADGALAPLTGSAGDYPTLLYDGPFSDGATAGSYQLLETLPEVDLSGARAKLEAFISAEDVSYQGMSHPEVDVYEFRLRSGEYSLSAGVTKRGGEILYILPDEGVGETNYTEAQLLDAAKAFLISRGYGAMEMSYYSRYGGILTVNYAASQDGVILYSDLLKLQLSMKDGSVIGLDAKSYLKNHVPRTIGTPAISQDEAMLRVGARLAPLSARLCLIPQNNSEYLCYEVLAADASGEFLVYIDAQTGVERELMQVLSRENGTLVM